MKPINRWKSKTARRVGVVVLCLFSPLYLLLAFAAVAFQEGVPNAWDELTTLNWSDAIRRAWTGKA